MQESKVPFSLRRSLSKAPKYACLYGIVYPIYFLCAISQLLCFTGHLPRCEPCGTGRMQRHRRERAQRRVERNAPRPLYRCKVKGKKKTDAFEWMVDEKTLNQRRSLSVPPGSRPRGEELRGWRHRVPKTSPSQRHEGTERYECDSLLFSLPAEVRAIIWRFCVGDRDIHISYGTPVYKQPFVFPLTMTLLPVRIKRTIKTDKLVRRLSGVECEHRPAPNGWENSHPYKASCPECGVLWSSYGEPSGKVDWQVAPTAISDCEESGLDLERMGTFLVTTCSNTWRPLALLATCRQIYAEALPLLYSTNTFHFPIPYEHMYDTFIQLSPIPDFTRTLLPQRCAQITRISISTVLGPAISDLANVLRENLPGLQRLDLKGWLDHRDRHMIQALGRERAEAHWVDVRSGLEKLVTSIREGGGDGAKLVLMLEEAEIAEELRGLDGLEVRCLSRDESLRKQEIRQVLSTWRGNIELYD